jgi:hypothetical protein
MGLKDRFKDLMGITKIVTSHWLDASGMQEISELKTENPKTLHHGGTGRENRFLA